MGVDPSGLWDWGQYFSDVWEFLKGEGTAINPVNWVKGGVGAYNYVRDHGCHTETFKQLGSGMLDSLMFWNHTDDLHKAGEGFMSVELLATPGLKKISSILPSIEVAGVDSFAISTEIGEARPMIISAPMKAVTRIAASKNLKTMPQIGEISDHGPGIVMRRVVGTAKTITKHAKNNGKFIDAGFLPGAKGPGYLGHPYYLLEKFFLSAFPRRP